MVEAASGSSYPDYIRRRIFQPAGAETLRIDSVTDLIPHRAQGYRRGVDGKLHNSNLADTSYKIPGGGLCGSVEDLAKLAIAVQSGRIVKPETLKLMWTRQKLLDGGATGYGLGWNLSERLGESEVAHGGGQQRISTYLLLLPGQKSTVVLMTNLEGARIGGLARQVADIALGR